MKMLFWCLVFCFSAVSQAALLTLQADRTQYQVGETVQLNLWLSEFPGSVGSYWAKLHYEPAAFVFADGQFGDSFAGASLQYLQSAADMLTLEEYAFWDADVAQLSALQGSGFALARISFVAKTAGDWSFNFADDFIGAELFSGATLPVQAKGLTLQVQAVSAPAGWSLLLLAGLAFRFSAGWRRLANLTA